MRSASRLLWPLLVLCVSTLAFSQAAIQPAVNSDPTYQQLRNIGIGTESVSVTYFDLKRDAATFHLHSGKVCFLSAVQGKVTGAVFAGEGSMSLTPPLPVEAKMLKLLTKEDTFNETFNKLVLRFTDATYEELKKANGAASSGGCDAGSLQDSQNILRHKIYYNLTGRILEDVLSTEPGGLFVAFVHGNRYEDKMVYFVDPMARPMSSRKRLNSSHITKITKTGPAYGLRSIFPTSMPRGQRRVRRETLPFISSGSNSTPPLKRMPISLAKRRPLSSLWPTVC